jgi:hypothetical protein
MDKSKKAFPKYLTHIFACIFVIAVLIWVLRFIPIDWTQANHYWTDIIGIILALLGVVVNIIGNIVKKESIKKVATLISVGMAVILIIIVAITFRDTRGLRSINNIPPNNPHVSEHETYQQTKDAVAGLEDGLIPPINELDDNEDDGTADIPKDGLTFDGIMEILTDRDNPRNEHYPRIYPAIFDESFGLESFLRTPNAMNIMEFFRTSSDLLSLNTHTYPAPNSFAMLNSPSARIESLKGETYGRVVRRVDSAYIEMHPCFMIALRTRGDGVSNDRLDEMIDTYTQFLWDLNQARQWSIEETKGLDIDLVSIIARNYMERGILLGIRGDGLDNVNAISDFMSAIMRYAEIYRMSRLRGHDHLIVNRNILYWIASAYFNMGAVQHGGDNFVYMVGSFVNADAFFSESIDNGQMHPFFQAHAKLYAAMAARNVIISAIELYNQKGAALPRELVYYIDTAYTNYTDLKRTTHLDNTLLATNTRDYIDQALRDIRGYIDLYLIYYSDEPHIKKLLAMP